MPGRLPLFIVVEKGHVVEIDIRIPRFLNPFARALL